jgi:hypothetical protein
MGRRPAESTLNREQVRSPRGVHLLFDCIKTVSKGHLKQPLGCPSSEEQIPQVIEKTEKTGNGMDGLEGSFTRPTQVRRTQLAHKVGSSD